MGSGASQQVVIPDAITTEFANGLQDQVRALVPSSGSSTYFPKVMMSYGTGSRSADAKGTGPGLIFAAKLALLLNSNNIPCFSGLHVGKYMSVRGDGAFNITRASRACWVPTLLARNLPPSKQTRVRTGRSTTIS